MTDGDTKLCRVCDVVKPVAAFYTFARRGERIPRSPCKDCHLLAKRQSYREEGGKDLPYALVLMRDYGLTLAQYEEMSQRLDGRCAVCHQPETKRRKDTDETFRLQVDHDHETGAVRDLLCGRCNYLVGVAEAAGDVLETIFAYLARHRADGPWITVVPAAERRARHAEVVAEVKRTARARRSQTS